MSAKEQREFQEGKEYGKRHPGKIHGWTRSVAWNEGLKAGQSEHREEYRERQKRIEAYRRYEREKEKALKQPDGG